VPRIETLNVDDRITSQPLHCGPRRPLEDLHNRVEQLEDELRSVVRCLEESQWNDAEDAQHLRTMARRIRRVLGQ
jgi:hypothetical protein